MMVLQQCGHASWVWMLAGKRLVTCTLSPGIEGKRCLKTGHIWLLAEETQQSDANCVTALQTVKF